MLRKFNGNNLYFMYAIENLKKIVFKLDNEVAENYSFIYFRPSLINTYTNDYFFDHIRKNKVIIICDPTMHPVALFFFNCFSKIMTIANASDSVELLIKKINYIHQNEIRLAPNKVNAKALSITEFNILSMTLSGKKVKEIASRLNLTIKKTYAHNHNIAKKMGVRKIHDLLMIK